MREKPDIASGTGHFVLGLLEGEVDEGGHAGGTQDVEGQDGRRDPEGLYYDWEFRSPLPPAIGPAGSRQLGGHPNQQEERYSDR